MKLFFVYAGNQTSSGWVDRLSALDGYEVVAAFPIRSEAVEYALKIKERGVVVVERSFFLQTGDDNNLISECEFDRGVGDCPTCEEGDGGQLELPIEEDDGVLRGTASIFGIPVDDIGVLKADVSLNGSGVIRYTWFYSHDGLYWDAIPQDSGFQGFSVLQLRMDYLIGAYIRVVVTRDGMLGEVCSKETVPVIKRDENTYPVIQGTVSIKDNIQTIKRGETLEVDLSKVEGTEGLRALWFYISFEYLNSGDTSIIYPIENSEGFTYTVENYIGIGSIIMVGVMKKDHVGYLSSFYVQVIG